MASKVKIKEIESLLEKYYDGVSSLEEEKILQDYFCNNKVPAHLEYDQAQFVFYKQEAENKTELEFNFNQPNKAAKLKRLNWFNYAAAAALLISVGWFSNQKFQEVQKQNEIRLAYQETQKAFELLATNFNKGLEGAEKLSELNKAQSTIINKKYSK